MLVVDPLKRITIPEIRDHPWFTNKLPVYLSLAPCRIEKEVNCSGERRCQRKEWLFYISRCRIIDEIFLVVGVVPMVVPLDIFHVKIKFPCCYSLW